MNRIPKELVDKIGVFSSCEIADALIKLKQPSGGYLADINLQTHKPILVKDEDFSSDSSSSSKIKLYGQIFTVQMVLAQDNQSPRLTEHFVDVAEPDTVMVISSPIGCKSAVWGGLMTARAVVKGIKGVVIDGRCRDLAEIKQANLMVFARGHSILGQSTFTRPSRVQVPIAIPNDNDNDTKLPPTVVNPYDILVADEDGVVVVPQDLADKVIHICSKNVAVDRQCLLAIQNGHSVSDTFAKYRQN